MARTIAIWHQQMTPEAELMYLEGIRQVEQLSPLPRWALFAGCGIASKFWSAYSVVLRGLYGIHIEFPIVLYSEKDTAKRRFLNAHLPASAFVSTDVMHLPHADAAFNERIDRSELLPHGQILDAGVPCHSRTSLSCNSSKNKNCVQEGREATGEGFVATCQTSFRHGMNMVSCECVTLLGQKDPDDKDAKSDKEFIVDEFRKQKFWSHAEDLDAEEWGSYPARSRSYWAALRGLVGTHAEITHFFKTVHNSFKVKMPMPTSYFITLDEKQRREEAATIGVPLHSEFGPREPKREKDEYKWKLEHKLHFEGVGVAWPIDWGAVSAGLQFNGLLMREREAVVYFDSVFPAKPATTSPILEFIDVNPSIGRIMKSYVDWDLSLKDPTSSPWHTRPTTIVGSANMVVRISFPGNPVATVRLLECFEYMRMIGWGDDEWAIPELSKPPGGERSCDYLELVANMVGNAYSVYHYGPWNMAMLSTFGTYHKDLGRRGHVCESSSSEGKSSASDSDSD